MAAAPGRSDATSTWLHREIRIQTIMERAVKQPVDREIVSTRIVMSPPDRVFRACTDSARLARWWGPHGFTNTFHTFEFREGGSWLFTMHGPDGVDHPNQSEFLEIVPGSLVRIKHVSLPRFELSISLEPSATGTRVSWVGSFESRDFAAKARQFLETANEQNLDRLALEVTRGSSRGS